jgi:hypothetical protein
MFRSAFAALTLTTLVALVLFQGIARAEEEIQGIALVKVEDPKKGPYPIRFPAGAAYRRPRAVPRP